MISSFKHILLSCVLVCGAIQHVYGQNFFQQFFDKSKKETPSEQEITLEKDEDITGTLQAEGGVVDSPVPTAKPTQSNKNLSYIGSMQTYVSSYEDTLLDIARDNNLGFVEIRSANPSVDPWLPGEDTEIIIPTQHILPDAPRQGLVINLAEMRLYSFIDSASPRTHPIGVGREGLKTPTGTTFIAGKKEGPKWRPTARMRRDNPDLPEVVEAGPDNPLGTHALYLGWREYLIHGTAKPWGIGRRVSSGCIRMYPEDIIKLYEATPHDTPVTVVDQPIKMAWINGVLYMEAHTSIQQSQDVELEGEVSYDVPNGTLARLKEIAGDHVDKLDWDKVDQVLKERRGYPEALLSL